LITLQEAIKRFDQTFSKVWPPAGPPEATHRVRCDPTPGGVALIRHIDGGPGIEKKRAGDYNRTMDSKKNGYRQQVAFINRKNELEELRNFINKEPSEILFLHGPKRSGKTTLLYRFVDYITREQKMAVKFTNLRETFISGYKEFLKSCSGAERNGEKTGSISSDRDAGLFKTVSSLGNKNRENRANPLNVMKAEFEALSRRGIKPVLIIDELRALAQFYLKNGSDRQWIMTLFDFLVALSGESHLAHVLIVSSDGYFINQVYTDSRWKKASAFYKVDYLNKTDVMACLLNLEKNSGITAYALSSKEAEKIWDTVGGSIWEIQEILTYLFQHPLEKVITLYKEKMKGIIVDYMMKPEREKIENLLGWFRDNDELPQAKVKADDENLLQEMVKQNILYFDPMEAKYYLQARSYRHGILRYFREEGLTS
jgi:uncharacterized protein